MLSRSFPTSLRYAIGGACFAAATLLRILLAGVLDSDVLSALHVLATFGSAWLGGVGPGLLTAALSALCCVHPATDPLRAFEPADGAGVALFFVSAGVIAVATARLRQVQAVLRSRRESDGAMRPRASDGIVVTDNRGHATHVNPAAIRPAGASVAPPHAAPTPTPSAIDESRLQSILDASEARIFHLDRRLRLTWSNRAFRERHGIDASGTGAGLATLFEPHKRAALMRPLQRTLQGRGETLEWRGVDAQGASCWTFTMITPDFDAAGAVRGCIVLSIDTTARHNADAARRRGEDHKRGVMENLPDLIWMAAADGTCEWFNHRWAEYAGRAVADWRDPIHPEDRQRHATAWAAAQAQGEPFVSEVRLRRHDDVWRWHLLRVQPLHESVTDSGIWGWCGSCTDIDDQKRAAATLRTTHQRFSTFLGTLSHELRNPLAALSAAVEVIRHPRAAPGMTARAAETLDRQTKLLARMVDELLDAARLMEGRVDLQRRCVALNELLREVCEDLTPRAANSHVNLHCEVPEHKVLIDADLLRIKQAVENLVINALEACAAGATVTVSVIEGHAGEAGIRVADSGCGLSAEDLGSLFEPGSAPRRDKAVGLGLGLKTVNRIVHLHGGRVVANSDGPGTGATFELFFPLHDAHAAAAVAAETVQDQLLSGQRILIIGDASAGFDTIRAPLESSGAQVRRATHGFEGLRIAAAWSPTTLICDLDLPAPLSGYDVLRQVLPPAGQPRPRLIAVGSNEGTDVADARKAGFDDCLVKPVSTARLLDTLEQADTLSAASMRVS